MPMRPSKHLCFTMLERDLKAASGENGIDAACQRMRNRKYFKTDNYVGVDIELPFLEKGINSFGPDVQGVLGDIVELHMPAACENVVVSTKTLSHMQPDGQVKAARNLSALVRTNGLLIVELPSGQPVKNILEELGPQYARHKAVAYGSPMVLAMEPGLMRIGQSKWRRKLTRPFVKLTAALDPLICKIFGNPAHVYIRFEEKKADIKPNSPFDGAVEIAPRIYEHQSKA